VGQGIPIFQSSPSHTDTPDTQTFSSPQKPVPDNTQHLQERERDIGIRIHNFSKRAAADPRLRPRGYGDRSDSWKEEERSFIDYGPECVIAHFMSKI